MDRRINVGDVVVANEKSKCYGITNQRYGCVGRVINIRGNSIGIKVIKHLYRDYIGQCFDVFKDCFDKISCDYCLENFGRNGCKICYKDVFIEE